MLFTFYCTRNRLSYRKRNNFTKDFYLSDCDMKIFISDFESLDERRTLNE